MSKPCCGNCDWATPRRNGELICCNLGGQPRGKTFVEEEFASVRFGEGTSCPEHKRME